VTREVIPDGNLFIPEKSRGLRGGHKRDPQEIFTGREPKIPIGFTF